MLRWRDGAASAPRPATGGSLSHCVDDNHDLSQRPPKREVAGHFLPLQITSVMLYRLSLLTPHPGESVPLVLKPLRAFVALSFAVASRTTRRELSIHGLDPKSDWDEMLWHDKRFTARNATDFTS